MKYIVCYVVVVVLLYASSNTLGSTHSPAVTGKATVVARPSPTHGSLTWQLLDIKGPLPGPRSSPANAVRPDGQRWTILGGDKHRSDDDATASIYTDLWDYDFANFVWISRPYSGQIPVADWRSCLYVNDGRLLTWGGRNIAADSYVDANSIFILPPNTNDTAHQWYSEASKFTSNEFAGYTWISVEVPTSSNSDTGTDTVIYVFGGTSGLETTGVGVTWKHTLATINAWEELNSNAEYDISSRVFHSAVYRPSDHKWYIFAGTQDAIIGTNLNDLWSFDFATEAWSKIHYKTNCVPQARFLHAAALHPEDIGMFVFGGLLSQRSSVSDLWMYNFADGRWVEFVTTGWSESNRRDGHSMAFWTDVSTNATWLYVFGGDLSNDKKLSFYGDSTQFNDLHRIQLDSRIIGCTDGVDSCKCAYTEEQCILEVVPISNIAIWIWLLVLLIIVVVAAIGIGGFCYYTKYVAKKKESVQEIYYSDDEEH